MCMKYIIGVDEVGRGPIAGPVTICVFLAHADYDILKHFKQRKLRDSKKLSETERGRIRTELNKAKLAGFVDFTIVSKPAHYIDKHGISKSINRCIEEGLLRLLRLHYTLDSKNCQIELDGALRLKPEFVEKVQSKYRQKIEYRVTVKGDEKIPGIACASILAKVARDNYMKRVGLKLYNEKGRWYNFAQNVGYGTKEHYELLNKHDISAYHRQSFLSNFKKPL
jgi:ribonuclease HII